ncbi:MAG: ABC transporter ATP-binding protein [Ilumatobacteraceae bacterium]
MISARGLSKSFGTLEVVGPLDLDVVAGSFVSIIGPSGCGKSTLLRLLGGLELATAGEVVVDGRSPATVRHAKQVAIVPQQPGLLPWRTVLGNARLLLDVRRKANPPAASDPEVLLRTVGLADFLGAYPHQLSGGMQQRVALVRALSLGAPLLLMDEPFAALDEITRTEMRTLLTDLVEGRGATTLFVTHSIAEAVALADRVLVTSPRPATVVADIAVDLARPRRSGLDDDPRFVQLCAEVRHALQAAMSATAITGHPGATETETETER